MAPIFGYQLLRHDRWPFVAAAAGVLVLAALLARRRRGFLLASLNLGLRLAALLLVAVWLLEPTRVVVDRSPGSWLAALDLSRSVRPAARRDGLARLESAARAGGSNLVVHPFGGGDGPLPVAAPERDALLDAPGGLDSDPRRALASLLLGPEAASGAARLAVLTDGGVHAVDVDARRLDPLVFPLEARQEAGVVVSGLDTARPVQTGEPVQLVLRGSAGRSVAATAAITVDGVLQRQVPAPITAGAFEVPLTLPALSPGTHLVGVRLDVADDEPLDNRAALRLDIPRPTSVAVVLGSERSLVADALSVQGLEPARRPAAGFVADPAPSLAADVLVLDRVPTELLGAPELVVALRGFVQRGGGLLYLPRDMPGELLRDDAKGFVDLLPIAGRELPPPPPEPKPEPPKAELPNEGLAPPDPEKRTKEKRLAPSLGLLLVVDASKSMEGETLVLAKAAAVAAAEVLHPEDHVGVIAFNSEPDVVLELTRSASLDEIKDRVSRIRAAGGTHFGNALQAALETFEDLAGPRLAIKHVILLSDGASAPCPLERLVKDMVARGITVSTVGCGPGMDEQTLSNIAAWGQGRFQPAFNIREIPQVFTIEAERVIQSTGARRRRDAAANPEKEPKRPDPAPTPPGPTPGAEKPAPTKPEALVAGFPAPYLRGVDLSSIPGLLGRHPAVARPNGWVSAKTEGGAPFIVHGSLGEGRIVAFTAPLDGPWAAALLGLDPYPAFVAQVVRFLDSARPSFRHHVEAVASGRSVTVRVTDRRARSPDPTKLRLAVEDETGAPLDAVVDPEPEGFRIRLPAAAAVAAVVPKLVAPGETPGSEETVAGFASVAPVPEIATAGLDVAGLEALARSLGGTLEVALPERLVAPERTTSRAEALSDGALPWLLAVLALDLVTKRLFPGSAARGRGRGGRAPPRAHGISGDR